MTLRSSLSSRGIAGSAAGALAEEEEGEAFLCCGHDASIRASTSAEIRRSAAAPAASPALVRTMPTEAPRARAAADLREEIQRASSGEARAALLEGGSRSDAAAPSAPPPPEGDPPPRGASPGAAAAASRRRAPPSSSLALLAAAGAARASPASAALRANTSPSSSEFEASLLPPCRPECAHSPTANRPASAVSPASPAATPPHM